MKLPIHIVVVTSESNPKWGPRILGGFTDSLEAHGIASDEVQRLKDRVRRPVATIRSVELNRKEMYDDRDHHSPHPPAGEGKEDPSEPAGAPE